MFRGRYNHFRCDECGLEVQVTRFPDEWVYATAGLGPVEHFCEICKEKPSVKTRSLHGQSVTETDKTKERTT